MTHYMERVMMGEERFDYEAERETFEKVFGLLDETLGDVTFVQFRGDRGFGGLKPSFFESFAIGVYECFDEIKDLPRDVLRRKMIEIRQRENIDFWGNIGLASNSRALNSTEE